jgi:hypothetical protein
MRKRVGRSGSCDVGRVVSRGKGNYANERKQKKTESAAT